MKKKQSNYEELKNDINQLYNNLELGVIREKIEELQAKRIEAGKKGAYLSSSFHSNVAFAEEGVMMSLRHIKIDGVGIINIDGNEKRLTELKSKLLELARNNNGVRKKSKPKISLKS